MKDFLLETLIQDFIMYYSSVSLLLLKSLLVNFCNFGCVVQRHRVSGVSFLKSLTHRNLCSFCLHLEISAYY